MLDLTDATLRAALAAEDQELRGPRRRVQERGARHRPLRATQRLGQTAHASSQIGGLRYPSAKVGGAGLPSTNLVEFADRLAAAAGTAYLEVVTPTKPFEQPVP